MEQCIILILFLNLNNCVVNIIYICSILAFMFEKKIWPICKYAVCLLVCIYDHVSSNLVLG